MEACGGFLPSVSTRPRRREWGTAALADSGSVWIWFDNKAPSVLFSGPLHNPRVGSWGEAGRRRWRWGQGDTGTERRRKQCLDPTVLLAASWSGRSRISRSSAFCPVDASSPGAPPTSPVPTEEGLRRGWGSVWEEGFGAGPEGPPPSPTPSLSTFRKEGSHSLPLLLGSRSPSCDPLGEWQAFPVPCRAAPGPPSSPC